MKKTTMSKETMNSFAGKWALITGASSGRLFKSSDAAINAKGHDEKNNGRIRRPTRLTPGACLRAGAVGRKIRK
jgi:hypothetical protein